MGAPPRIIQDEMYQLLRDGNVARFNELKAEGKTCDMRCCDFRGLDLRKLDADGLDLEDAYFRRADLRGVDLRNTNIHGCSFAESKISGCFLPAQVDPQEMLLSLQYGTRIRYLRDTQDT